MLENYGLVDAYDQNELNKAVNKTFQTIQEFDRD